jgi:prepilin-type N-terminal cleavage/methylation domain-containing protein
VARFFVPNLTRLHGRTPDDHPWEACGEDVRRSEIGFTLIEVLVAVIVIGIAFVALLSGMAVLVKSSRLHQTQAVAEVEVRRYAELAEGAYSSTGDYSAGTVGYSAPAGFTTAPPSVQCSPSGTPPACSGTGNIQLVTLSVSSTSGGVAEHISVVMRGP